MYKDKDTIVRLMNIEIQNFKNTEFGSIDLGDINHIENGTVDIRGIYGQNGSGKTSIVDAIGIVKQLISGQELDSDIVNYIKVDKEALSIKNSIYIKTSEKEYDVEYILEIGKDEMNHPRINSESVKLRIRQVLSGEEMRLTELLSIDNLTDTITPNNRKKELTKLYEEKLQLNFLSFVKRRENKSFIFSKELIEKVEKSLENISEGFEVLDIIKKYMITNLFVINNKQLALSDANIILPFNFKKYGKNNKVSLAVMAVELEAPVFLPVDAISEIRSSLNKSNKVLSQIVPGLSIEIRELSNKITKDNEEEVQIELISCKNEEQIPLRYESDGIKKIVSIIHLLIHLYNRSTFTVFIDELDSGIFEYLLGEILDVIQNNGKGQLIFTSHNLRPLEVLDKNSLIFTTVNPKERYLKMQNVKNNNNMRSLYFRDLVLDGQKESLYEKTSPRKIAYAFELAGEASE